MVRTVVVGCAARFLPDRDVVVVAVESRDGGHTDTIRMPAGPGSPVAAQAVAAILGMELAATLGYRAVTVMLTGQLTLCARIRTRQAVPELDAEWNDRLHRAYASVRELSTISTSPDTAGTLQTTAVARCEALATTTTAQVARS